MEKDNNGFETPKDSEVKEESTIFSEPGLAEQKYHKKNRKKSLEIQLIAAAVLVVIVAAAILVYLLAVKPALEYEEPEPEKEAVELLDGELLGTNDRILIFDHIERNELESVEIVNTYGEWGFYYNEEDEDFYVIGHDGAPYSKEKFSSLVVSTGYAIAMERVTAECEDFSEYGLDREDVRYTVTTRTGDRHTIYVGDKIPSGAGYYVRYEGRDAVYILSADLEDTVMNPLENMITPMLTIPMAANDYFTIRNFAVMQGSEVSIMITYLTEEEKEADAATSAYKMIYPSGYAVNSTAYSDMLQVITSFAGTSTLVYAPDEADLEKYGLSLSDPAFTLYFEYKDVPQYVLFSSKNENGSYYAFSPLFNLITELDGESVEWLEWDLIKWVDMPIFMKNINDIATITVTSDTAVRNFELAGEAQELIVTESDTRFKPQVQNFRQFYKSLLSIYLQGYAADDLGKEEIAALSAEDKTPYLTLRIETRAGVVTEYKFYPYSTRRAYYTVNGEGTFYVLRDMVTKIITDCEKVMTDTPVDSEAHS